MQKLYLLERGAFDTDRPGHEQQRQQIEAYLRYHAKLIETVYHAPDRRSSKVAQYTGSLIGVDIVESDQLSGRFLRAAASPETLRCGREWLEKVSPDNEIGALAVVSHPAMHTLASVASDVQKVAADFFGAPGAQVDVAMNTPYKGVMYLIAAPSVSAYSVLVQ